MLILFIKFGISLKKHSTCTHKFLEGFSTEVEPMLLFYIHLIYLQNKLQLTHIEKNIYLHSHVVGFKLIIGK